MKIVKHVDIEYYSGISDVAGEACQGILTGLISIDEKRLEITNCFPTPRSDVLLEGEEANSAAITQDDKQNEIIDMLKRFRNMNIDYENVGFYQTHPFGACFNQEVIESLYDYQMTNPEAVILIYDPIQTRQGHLSLRAYRLSKKALDLCTNSDWSIDSVRHLGLTFNGIMDELPIKLKSSHLMNVLLAELALSNSTVDASHMELGTRRAFEKSMRSLMVDIDELNKGVSTYNKYIQEKQKFDASYNALLQKRQAENEARAAKGEPPLPLDDIRKILKQPQLQLKNGLLDLQLNALDINALTDYQSSIAAENIAKLFISKAVSEVSSEKHSSYQRQ